MANQLPSFSFHSIFEEFPEDNPIFETPNLTEIEVPYLGGSKKTKDQYTYLIKILTSNLEAIGAFRSYKVDNHLIKFANEHTYMSINQYNFYQNDGNYSVLNVSIQSALMDYTIQLSKLSSFDKVDPEIFKTSIVMNPLVNTNMINNMISLSIEYLSAYIRSIESDMYKLMMIILIVVIIFFVIYYFVLTFVEIHKIQSNKHEIYSCLTSLPKNVVSGLAEALRILKKDSEATRTTEIDTEFSKQEDNILKIFATAGDDSAAMSSDRHAFVICNVYLLIIYAFLTYLLTNMFKKVTSTLNSNSPHLNYVFGSTAYMMNAMNINIAATGFTNSFNYSTKSIDLLKKLNVIFSYFNYYY